MLKGILIIVLVVLIAGLVYAEAPYRESPKPTTRDFISTPINPTSFTGLLDASRLSMGHQMGMSYSSWGGRGFTQGYYQNTLSYKFNAPVLLRLRTGVTNNPYAPSSGSTGPGGTPFGGMFNDAEFFGGADIDWKPRDNVFLRLSVNRLPPGMYYTNSAYNRWSMFGPGYDFGPRYVRPVNENP